MGADPRTVRAELRWKGSRPEDCTIRGADPRTARLGEQTRALRAPSCAPAAGAGRCTAHEQGAGLNAPRVGLPCSAAGREDSRGSACRLPRTKWARARGPSAPLRAAVLDGRAPTVGGPDPRTTRRLAGRPGWLAAAYRTEMAQAPWLRAATRVGSPRSRGPRGEPARGPCAGPRLGGCSPGGRIRVTASIGPVAASEWQGLARREPPPTTGERGGASPPRPLQFLFHLVVNFFSMDLSTQWSEWDFASHSYSEIHRELSILPGSSHKSSRGVFRVSYAIPSQTR